MNRKKKKKTLWIVVLLCVCAGIAFLFLASKKSQLPEDTGVYEHEMGASVDVNHLEDGNLYVLHDNKFYPLPAGEANDTHIADTSTDNTRVLTFSEQDAQEIPTLFLENGDQLVYYSTTDSLRYVTFERYTDVGWSLGCYGLAPAENGYYYLTTNNDATYHSTSSAADLYQQFSTLDTVAITQIGKKSLTEDHVVNAGIILGLEKGEVYNVDVYAGTIYHAMELAADTRFFTGMEVYLEAALPLEEETYQRIDIPEYFLDGYYYVEGIGMVRVCHDNQYTNETNFNERLLEISTVYEDGADVIPANEPTWRYSTIEEYCSYAPKNPESFGYDAAQDDAGSELDSEKITHDEALDPAQTKEVPLVLQAGQSYAFTVSSAQKGGNLFVYFGSSRTDSENIILESSQNAAGKYVYQATVQMDETTPACLVISSLTDNYEINCSGADKIPDGTETPSYLKDQESGVSEDWRAQ